MDAQARAALDKLREKRRLASNNAHWLRDGRRACGLTLRATIGTVCMLREARNPIVTNHRDVDTRDALQIALFCSDEWRGDCINAVSTGIQACDDLTDEFVMSMSPRKQRKVIDAVNSMMGDLREAAEYADEDESDEVCGEADPKWWISYTYVIARKTGWPEHYILWELPMYRATAYAEMIHIEHGEKEDLVNGVKSDTVEALELIVASRSKENG